MNNSRKLTRSAIFGQLPILVQLISGLVVMPRMVHYFGDRNYGLWVLVAAFLGYFGLLDFGFSKAIIRFVSASIGKKNREASDGWITIGLVLFIAMSLVGFVFLIGGVWCCKYFVSDNLYLVQKVLLIGGVSFLISFPSRCSVGVLQAHVRGDVLDSIISGVAVLRLLIFLIALYLRLSFFAFVWILALTELLQGGLLVVASLRVHRGFIFRTQWLNRERIKSFMDFSGFSFVAQLSDLIRFQMYPVIISSFLGLSAVTTFAIANRMRTILSQVYNKVLVNFTPVFSQIEGRAGSGEELKEAYLFAYKISTYFVFFTGGLTMLITKPFILRWMGAEHLASATLLWIALVGSIAAGIQVPTVCLLFGTSHHRFYAISNSIEALMILGSSIIFAQLYGLVGIVAGASVSTLLVKTFVQPLWLSRILNISVAELHLKHTLRNLLRILYFLVLPVFFHRWLRPEYWSIMLYTLGICVLFSSYIWMVGFSVPERRRLYASLPICSRFGPLSKFLERTLR